MKLALARTRLYLCRHVASLHYPTVIGGITLPLNPAAASRITQCCTCQLPEEIMLFGEQAQTLVYARGNWLRYMLQPFLRTLFQVERDLQLVSFAWSQCCSYKQRRESS